MGIAESTPYARTIRWHDPRDRTGGDRVGETLHSEWVMRRQKKAQCVKFDHTFMEKVFAVIASHSDKGGNLSQEALQKCLKRLGVADSAKAFLLWKRFDANGDGYISGGEFCDTLLEYVNGGQHFAILQSCFGLFDTARTGRVTLADLEIANRMLDSEPTAEDLVAQRAGAAADPRIRTKAQIVLLTRLVKGCQRTGEEPQHLSFNEFVAACSRDNMTLVPFTSHIIALMCSHLVRAEEDQLQREALERSEKSIKSQKR